jgi:hypothetical protein
MPSTDDLLIKLILYGVLPLWGITGFIDWCCHRATRIERTSGLKESLMHSLMGIQLGVPIILCLTFQVNVLLLLLCIAAWLSHEFVAHWDVMTATPKRVISIWEMHVHNYMATIPLYLLALIAIINWDITVQLFSLEWQGQMRLASLPAPLGSSNYVRNYLAFMAVLCVVPYLEENLRCWRAARDSRSAA